MFESEKNEKLPYTILHMLRCSRIDRNIKVVYESDVEQTKALTHLFSRQPRCSAALYNDIICRYVHPLFPTVRIPFLLLDARLQVCNAGSRVQIQEAKIHLKKTRLFIKKTANFNENYLMTRNPPSVVECHDNLMS